ncbi:MAG: low molecular weight protein-tyrosine-phosphatase [Candidatus Hydrogenedentota bacterium]
MDQVRVLFVCLGNICRSPMAEGIFRQLVEERGLVNRIMIDSAGTGAWHVGEPPDARAQREVRKHGLDISRQQARQVRASDFEKFDYIVAMDRDNLADLEAQCPPACRNRLFLCTQFVPDLGMEGVPDPFFGGTEGFARVFELIRANANALLDKIAGERLASGRD